MMMPTDNYLETTTTSNATTTDLDDFLLLDKQMTMKHSQHEQQQDELLTEQQERHEQYKKQQQEQQQQQEQLQYFCDSDDHVYHHNPYDDDDNSKMQPKKNKNKKKVMKYQTINKYILHCVKSCSNIRNNYNAIMKKRYRNVCIVVSVLLFVLFSITRIVHYYYYDDNKNNINTTDSNIATNTSSSQIIITTTTTTTTLMPSSTSKQQTPPVLPLQQQQQQQQSNDKKLRNIKSLASNDNKDRQQYNRPSSLHHSHHHSNNNNPRVLLGIITFDIFGEEQYRNNYRQLFQLLYPRICHIHDYYYNNHIIDDNPCELIYTFVLYDTDNNNNDDDDHDVHSNYTDDDKNNSTDGVMKSSESELLVVGKNHNNYFDWLLSIKSFVWRMIVKIFNYHNKLLPLLYFRSSSLIDPTNNHHDNDNTLLLRLIQQQQNNNNKTTRYSNYSTDLYEHDMMFINKARTNNFSIVYHYNDYQKMKHQLTIDWLQFIICNTTTTFQENKEKEDIISPPPFFDYITYISTHTMISFDLYFQYIMKTSLPPFPYNDNIIVSSLLSLLSNNNNNNNSNSNNDDYDDDNNMDIISYNLIPYFLNYISNFDQQHHKNLKTSKLSLSSSLTPHDYLALFLQDQQYQQQQQYQIKNNNNDDFKKSSLDNDDDNSMIESYDHMIKHLPVPYPFWKHCSIRMYGPKNWNKKWIYELYRIMKRRHHIIGGRSELITKNSSSTEYLLSVIERRRQSLNLINNGVRSSTINNNNNNINKESSSSKTAMLRNVDPTFHLFLYKKYYETTTNNDTRTDSSTSNHNKYGNNELDDDFIKDKDDDDVHHYVSPPDVIIVDNDTSNNRNKGKKRKTIRNHNNNRHHNCHTYYDSANSINEYLNSSRNDNTDMFVIKWNQSGILKGTSFIRHDDWFRDTEIDHIRQIHPRNQNQYYTNHLKNTDYNNQNNIIMNNSKDSDIIAIVFNTDVLHHIDWTYIPPVPVLVYTIPNDVITNQCLNTSFTLIPPPYDRGYNQWCIWKAEHDNAIIPFDQRRNVIIWRGALHSTIDPNRITLVQMSANQSNDNRIWLNASLKDDHELPIEEMVQYKYHIDIGGESGTSWGGIRWKMCTGSLVFKVDTWSQDWWHSMIIPYIHYIPVKYDLSNLYEQYIYAELNPDIIYRIVQNGSKFCNDNVKLSTVVNYWRNVIETLPITMNPIIVNEANELIMKHNEQKQLQPQKVV